LYGCSHQNSEGKISKKLKKKVPLCPSTCEAAIQKLYAYPSYKLENYTIEASAPKNGRVQKSPIGFGRHWKSHWNMFAVPLAVRSAPYTWGIHVWQKSCLSFLNKTGANFVKSTVKPASVETLFFRNRAGRKKFKVLATMWVRQVGPIVL
jgi:hypothetical protein